jgi:glyceraldehyde 3-phosphate dehydrogenase
LIIPKIQISDALVIDKHWRISEEALQRHYKIDQVHKNAQPRRKGIPNIVHGVNHNEFNPDEVSIFCCKLYSQCYYSYFKNSEDTGVVKVI